MQNEHRSGDIPPKFEWRPEDVTILTAKEAADAEDDYEESSMREEDADPRDGGSS
jgi:hypothetical protein